MIGQLIGERGIRNSLEYRVKGAEPNIRAWAQAMCDHKSNTSCDIRFARNQLFLVCQRWGYTMDHLNPPKHRTKSRHTKTRESKHVNARNQADPAVGDP